jgi:hypothetical protein
MAPVRLLVDKQEREEMGLTLDDKKASAVAGQRLALLICNGTLQNNPDFNLPGVAKDAQRLDQVLSDSENCRFEVSKLLNRPLIEVRLEIARMCNRLSEADTLLIYYSGNGVTGRDGCLYLTVHDSDFDCPEATGLDAEFILSQLRNSRCRQIILIVDCCYAGAFFDHNRGIPNGLYAITSCGADESCTDTAEGGAFSLALCSGLLDGAADRDGDGLVSIDELHEYIKQKLKAEGYEWKPQKWIWNVPDPIFVTAVPRHVFLSYAREDMAEVDRLAEALQKEGLAVWIDRKGVRAGNWKDRVTEGLNHARALVVMLSPASLVSEAVRKELAFADSKKVPIIPFQLQEISDNGFPDWYGFEYRDLHRHIIEADQYDEGIKGLVSAIANLRTHNRGKSASG